MKTSELIGPALDWATCVALGYSIELDGCGFWIEANGFIGYLDRFSPQTKWARGGPIIEREKILTAPDLHNTWRASQPFAYEHTKTFYGPTLLIAAMRCFVASRLGDEVDIPEELK